MPEPEKAATSVKVALRCRPLLPKEILEGCQTCLTCMSGENQVILGRDKAFTYDFAFGPTETQNTVYEKAVMPLVSSLFKGFNATVLAYGQTGSGKTFTMGSTVTFSDNCEAGENHTESDSQQQQAQRGIIPHVIDDLFSTQASKEDYEFCTKVSFLEIYNEELTDLLASAPRGCSSAEDALSVREDINGIKIVGLTEVTVSTALETLRLLEKGSQSRTTAATNMNATSSRSHAIFTLHIEKKKKGDANDTCRAKFHLVDLAGSERAKRTGAEGSRFKEGVNINLGLLALGNVISALGDENGKRSHVPYRDSKLTRLLQDSLGGNSLTLMIACVSPADSNMEETLNTLRYADRARKIKNKPVVNRDPHTAEIFELRLLVQQLQAAVAANGGTGISSSTAFTSSSSSSSSSNGTAMAATEARKWEQMYRNLEEENRKLNTELQGAIDQSTELCEKVILAEVARDRLKAKLELLRTETGVTFDELENSLNDPSVKPELKEKLMRVKDIQTRLSKLEEETNQLDSLASIIQLDEEFASTNLSSATETAVTGIDVKKAPASPSSGRGSADDEDGIDGNHYSHSYETQRVKMSRELQQLNNLLSKKQELATQMINNEERMQEVQRVQEAQRQQTDLELQVARLQRERDALLEQTQVPWSVQRAQGGGTLTEGDHAGGSAQCGAAGKISEQRRQRLKELEAQIGELRKKITELSKVAKIKEQMDKQVVKLNSEIVDLKHQRVKLMRQMKDESETARRWKQDKDKEVMQLKARDRRMQCEVARLEQQSRLTQAYCRRKAEEAASANRRLKDALEKQQKASSERRGGSAGDSSHDLNSIGPRVKSYVNDEVEMQVSIRDAERHLQQQIADRRAINEQLQRLHGAEPAAVAAEQERRQKQIKSLEAEIMLSNAQISDLQQKIMDAKSSKNVSASERVQTMVEAKCALRHLVSLVVAAKLAESVSVSRNKELNTTYEESTKQIERLEAEIVELRQFHANEVVALQKEHEERTLVLLQQLSTRTAAGIAAGTGSSDDSQLRELVKTQADEIARLCNIEAEQRKALEDNARLKRELTSVRQRKGAPTLLPNLGVTDSPYLERGEKGTTKTMFSMTATGRSGNTVTKVKVDVAKRKPDLSCDNDEKATAGDIFEEDDDEESSDDSVMVDDEDQSWRQDEEDEILDPETPVRPKRKKQRSLATALCRCTTDCSSMRCSCKKKSLTCTSSCKCASDTCCNRNENADSSKENQPPEGMLPLNTKAGKPSTGSSTLNSTFLLDSSDSSVAQGKDRKRSSTDVDDHSSGTRHDSAADFSVPSVQVAKKRRLHNTSKQATASFFNQPHA